MIKFIERNICFCYKRVKGDFERKLRVKICVQKVKKL